MQAESLRRVAEIARHEVYADEIEPPDISATDFGWHYPYSFIEEWAERIIKTNYHALPFTGEWRDQPAHFVDDYYQYIKMRNRALWFHSKEKSERSNPPEGW